MEAVLKESQLQAICISGAGRRACGVYLGPLNELMPAYAINTRARVAQFLAQLAHESGDFTAKVESLYYTDPGRIAQIFKTGFDLNKNLKVDPAEIEFAKGYVRNSQKLANRAYANRNGNGPESSGDGFKYRGRGLIQLTGRANYASCGKGIGQNLLDYPELLEQPYYAVQAACWYWADRELNNAADAGDIQAVTRGINGPRMLGLEDRKAYLKRAQGAMA